MAHPSDNLSAYTDSPPPSPLQSLAQTLRTERKNPRSSSVPDPLSIDYTLTSESDVFDTEQEDVDPLLHHHRFFSGTNGLESLSGELSKVPFYTPDVTTLQMVACSLERTYHSMVSLFLWLSPLVVLKVAFSGSLFAQPLNPEKSVLFGIAMILCSIIGYVGAFRNSLSSFKQEDRLSSCYPSLFEAFKKIGTYYSGYILLAVLAYSTAGAIKQLIPLPVVGLGLALKVAFTIPLAYILATYGQILPSLLLNRKASLMVSVEQTKQAYGSLMKAILCFQGSALVLSAIFVRLAMTVSPDLQLFKTALQGTAGLVSVMGMVLSLNVVFGYFFTAGHHLNARYSRDPNITEK